jgi:hypothetical protein
LRHIDTGRGRYCSTLETTHPNAKRLDTFLVTDDGSLHHNTLEKQQRLFAFLAVCNISVVDEYILPGGTHTKGFMNANDRTAALKAENKAMRQRMEGLSYRVAELEAHVSEMDAARADMRCMLITLASAHLVNGQHVAVRADDRSNSPDGVVSYFAKGSIVRKQFGNTWFVGEIIEVDDSDPTLPYFVRYEDGDEEDMTHAELAKWVIHNPA